MAESWADLIHLFLSTIVLVILCLAAIQSLLLASQEWLLKHKQSATFIRYFPPLEIMESLLFALIFAALFFLTLLLISSFVLFQPLFEQGLWQKAVLSILGWFVLLILLIGRHHFGWRGKVAIRWTLIGFTLVGGVYLSALLFMPVF
ncbi:cytochrome c biogenesis protein CcsA [Rickettsiella massiliensis]|uniref:cytochrome c biogenesis protein CcsA n=1 Tax=Rickettsiella massiliensis TaxID=676517 RepID=UPI00029AE8C9|nr:cytochrome c biogenesis protein CcsA [Rickettsiella massiliensis]